MKILIAGDLVIDDLYEVGARVNQSMIRLFQESDYNILNLEAPVTNSQQKILKTGPHLKSHKESTQVLLQALQIDLVTLANNHIKDYDEKGVLDTISFCKENGISTIGAGKNKEKALEPFYFESEEGRIGIINIAENEWASATEEEAGANGMDLIEDVKKIREVKKSADYVFVIVHGGHEYYNLPSPRMQKQYRFYAEEGADIVIGHHTHCIGGMETYHGVPIYYSLGNFLFTKESRYEDWYSGMILRVDINNGKISTEQYFCHQSPGTFHLSLLKDSALTEWKERFRTLNSIINNESLLKEEWGKYILNKKKQYLNYWSPVHFIRNRYIKGLFRKMNVMLSHKKGLSYVLNLMRCEAHRDLSEESIKQYLRS